MSRRWGVITLVTVLLIGSGVILAWPVSATASPNPGTDSCQASAACLALVDELGQAAEQTMDRAIVHAMLAAKTVTDASGSVVNSYCTQFVGACASGRPGYPVSPGTIGRYNNITDVPGIEVGSYTDPRVLTGTTVLLTPHGSTVGVEVRGSAPGSRDTDPVGATEDSLPIYGLVLSGGSAYGLAAADGVDQYLEQHHLGTPQNASGSEVMPIVPTSIIFDPGRFGPFSVHPGASFGYAAAAAAKVGPFAEGNVGAGAGAEADSLKGGLGSASENLGNGIMVGAIVTINALGDPFDTGDGCAFYAARYQLQDEFGGLRPPPGGCGSYTQSPIISGATVSSAAAKPAGHNTTIGVVATNVALSPAMANRIAMFGEDGLALAIRPSHTFFDGDTVWAMSTGTVSAAAPTTTVGARIANAVAHPVARLLARTGADPLGALVALVLVGLALLSRRITAARAGRQISEHG